MNAVLDLEIFIRLNQTHQLFTVEYEMIFDITMLFFFIVDHGHCIIERKYTVQFFFVAGFIFF